MLLDSKLVFANNASAVVTNAIVTTNVNVLDTGADTYVQLASNANPDIGTGKEIWVKAVATANFTANVGVKFVLSHGAANNVANVALYGTEYNTTTRHLSNLSAATDEEKVIYDGPLPSGLQRWIRGSLYGNGIVAAGAFDCYLYVK